MSSAEDEVGEPFSFSSVEMDDSRPSVSPKSDKESLSVPNSPDNCAPQGETIISETIKADVHISSSKMSSSPIVKNKNIDLGSKGSVHTRSDVDAITRADACASDSQESQAQASSSVASASTGSPLQRTRLYNKNSKGPFTVWIKGKSGDLKFPLKLSKYINKYYKSVRSCVTKNGNMKVVFNDIKDANALVMDKSLMSDFALRVPAEYVEVEGAVDWFELCDLDSEEELITSGIGKFHNVALNPCKIIFAERLSKRSQNMIEWTNTVKLVFEGLLLPNFVEIYGLRVRVRPFHQKPMFCDRCQQFGHTSRDCKRKQKCPSCGAEHAAANCPLPKVLGCAICKSDYQHTKSECVYYAQVTESYQVKLANRRRARYNEAVASAHQESAPERAPTHPQPHVNNTTQFPPLSNRFEELNSDVVAATPKNPSRPRNPYSKVVREALPQQAQVSPAPKRRKTSFTVLSAQPTSAECTAASTQNGVAFGNPNTSSSSSSPSSSLAVVIMTAIRQSGLSPLWISIIEAIIEPLLEAFMPQLPNLISALAPAVLVRPNF